MIRVRLTQISAAVLFSLGGFTCEASTKNAVCNPPKESQWNSDLNALVSRTKKIVLARLTAAEMIRKKPDVNPDFKLPIGFAADGRRKSDGARASLHDDEMWSASKWTFEVQKTLKGNLKEGERFSLVTLLSSPDTKPQLSPLCDLSLNFHMGSMYVVFLGSYSPIGYTEVMGVEEEFYKTVVQTIAKSKAK